MKIVEKERKMNVIKKYMSFKAKALTFHSLKGSNQLEIRNIFFCNFVS